MGFMDKVKATAEKVGEKAQQGVAQGQQKLSEVQERKRVDGLLRDLGAATYHERTGDGTPALTSEIERLAATLREAEASGTSVDLPDGSDGDGPGANGDAAATAADPAAASDD